MSPSPTRNWALWTSATRALCCASEMALGSGRSPSVVTTAGEGKAEGSDAAADFGDVVACGRQPVDEYAVARAHLRRLWRRRQCRPQWIPIDGEGQAETSSGGEGRKMPAPRLRERRRRD